MALLKNRPLCLVTSGKSIDTPFSKRLIKHIVVSSLFSCSQVVQSPVGSPSTAQASKRYKQQKQPARPSPFGLRPICGRSCIPVPSFLALMHLVRWPIEPTFTEPAAPSPRSHRPSLPPQRQQRPPKFPASPAPADDPPSSSPPSWRRSARRHHRPGPASPAAA